MADSDVVLRCPNCGTVQSLPGECEACHESRVRYYCDNHAPGRWLDGPVCEECALRPKSNTRSEAPRAAPPRATPPRTPPAPAAPPAAPTRDTPPWTAPPTRPRRREPAPVPRDDWSVEPPRTADPRRASTVSLEELFESLRAAGRRTRETTREDMPARTELPDLIRARGVPAAFGCLKRLAVLAIIGAILFAMASAWFFSSVIV